ncbi:MAG: LysM peptidoglycan-binding domain-containing protein [Flavobacteriaceae bacterium]
MSRMLFNKLSFSLFFFLVIGVSLVWSQTPESFVNHRVKRGETLFSITKRYKISQPQLLEYNPMLERIGLKRRMTLRIPVYSMSSKQKVVDGVDKPVDTEKYQTHQVAPKETKWRLAYQYGTTVAALDSLNPQIREGLKIGQEIKIPNTETVQVLPEKDSLYNYYKVLPKEGFYRIEKKLGVNQATLDSLNPQLKVTGLQVGMILKIPGKQSGRLKIENDLLVERVNLLDSTLQVRKIKMGVLLPFKAHEIVFDSIEDTRDALESRNLHTISLDFYSGVRFAVKQVVDKGIDIEVVTFDTENKTSTIQKIVDSRALNSLDFLLGPLIPNNFNLVSNIPALSSIPKIAPLSSRPVQFRKNVIQSVTEASDFRAKMYTHLESVIDSSHNVVIVADSLNRKIEWELRKRFPQAITLRPEKEDYLLPELVDSLLVDSLPNKIFLETQSFPLIASALSQFNAQKTAERSVQVFTTFRSNAYDNENLSRKLLGSIQFTYPVGFKPLDWDENRDFINAFVQENGKPPNKEALRGYDVVMDALLRIAIARDLGSSIELGETEYRSNRFLYRKHSDGSFSNAAVFILQHQGYEIVEIKE